MIDGGDRFELVLVGVGGQGVLTAAKVLGDAAHAEGLPVVVGQLHGMTQRGGPVECTVLVGGGKSSFVTRGPDALVGFEPLEVLRALPRLAPRTRVVVNSGAIVPIDLARDGRSYPSLDEVVERVGRVAAEVTIVDGPALVREVGVGRTLNVVMLGALAGLGVLPFGADAVRGAVDERCPPRFRVANRAAFDLGLRRGGRGVTSEADSATTGRP